MNKIIIGVGLLGVVIFGWLLFSGNTAEYASTVDSEVSQLEEELASLEAAVASGTLSPEEAAKAQVKIIARLDAIGAATSAGQNAKLTDAQRTQLVEGLDRLKNVLTKYKATLASVDEAVLELPESERPNLGRRGGGSRGSVVSAVAAAVETIQEQVEDIIEEEIPDESSDEMASSTGEVSEGEPVDEDESTEDPEEVEESEDEAVDETTESEEDEDFIFLESESEIEVSEDPAVN